MARSRRYSAGSSGAKNRQFQSAPNTRELSDFSRSPDDGWDKAQDSDSTGPSTRPMLTLHGNKSDPILPVEDMLNADDISSMADTASPTLDTASKSKWNLPWALRHVHNPEHQHFCRNPAIQPWKKQGKRASGEGQAKKPSDAAYPANHITAGDTPAPPVTTHSWSSVRIGDRSVFTPNRRRSTLKSDPHLVLDAPTAVYRQGINGIVGSIRTYLSDRRHDTCSSPRNGSSSGDSTEQRTRSSGGKENQSAENGNGAPEESYLVTTTDIAGILDIVIAGLRNLHDEHLSTGCLSLLLPSPPALRPSTGAQAIVPPDASLAEPATTISSVQPSFSALSFQDHRYVPRKPSRTTKATFVSRQSVTEVNWDSASGSSEEPASTRDTTPRVLSDASSGRGHSPVAVAAQFPEFTRPAFGPQSPQGSQDPQDIVSFPKLRSRGSTNEWLAPPVPQPTPSPALSAFSDLYRSGIDAHSGTVSQKKESTRHIPDVEARNDSPAPTESSDVYHSASEARGGSPMPGNKTVQFQDKDKRPRLGSGIGASARQRKSLLRPVEERKSSLVPRNQDKNSKPRDRLGSAIGLSAHQRRVSLRPDASKESTKEMDPNAEVMDTLRRYSTVPYSSIPSVFPSQTTRKDSTKAALQEVLAQAPSRTTTWEPRNDPPERRTRCSTCSEDHYPHVCMDEQITPPKMPNVTVEFVSD